MNDFDAKSFKSAKEMLMRAVEEAVRFDKTSRLTGAYDVANDGKGNLTMTHEGQTVSFPIDPSIPHTEAIDQIVDSMLRKVTEDLKVLVAYAYGVARYNHLHAAAVGSIGLLHVYPETNTAWVCWETLDLSKYYKPIEAVDDFVKIIERHLK
jgi:hypothetical protein